MTTPKRSEAPSSLAEMGERLGELATSQDMIFERLDHILLAVRAMAAEVTATHQERIEITHRLTLLEHRVALLEGEKAT